HIVGRLDLNSSGLLLLTNDSRWSRKLMAPEEKVRKVYRVTLENDLSEDYISAFSEGMYFSFENITTQPAQLTIVSNKIAEVVLMEGKYHQIKRMFGRFRNPVLALHRQSVGNLILDQGLMPGESRPLTLTEVNSIF
ncbi:MAG: pseudouridine synthase, partial [Oleispira sp.]|nr:pseudouridine synthase [Oleispira sp.]